LSYFGRKRPGVCVDEVLTDLKKQHQGFRVRHRYQRNWIKMYDRFAQVLRVEVVIMGRYAHVTHQAAGRCLNGLAVVDDPKVSQDLLDQVVTAPPSRGVNVGNPLSRTDQQLFLALLRGEHALRDFRSRDLAPYLNQPPSRDLNQRLRQSGITPPRSAFSVGASARDNGSLVSIP
jgi:hypothetical protein